MALRGDRSNGSFRTRIHCDHCGEPIRSAAEGLVEWRSSRHDEAVDVFVIHLECRKSFESTRDRSSQWYTDVFERLPVRVEGSTDS